MAKTTKPAYRTNKLTYKVVLQAGDKSQIVEKTGRSVLFDIEGRTIGMAIQDAEPHPDTQKPSHFLVHVASGMKCGNQSLEEIIEVERIRTGHAPSLTDAASLQFENHVRKKGGKAVLAALLDAKVINPPPKGRV